MRLILICFFILIWSKSISQSEAHYWSHQFGAKGLLLNGAVISSADDETSIFYNPGAIVLDDNLGFAFSFLSPTYNKLSTENFLAQRTSITDSGFGFSPGFLAVRVRPFKTNKLVLGVASFKRYKGRIKFEDRISDKIEDGALFVFRSDLEFQRTKSEDWFGLALGYKLSDNLGIGISQFSVWHSQNLDFNFTKEILLSPDPFNIVQSWRAEFDYDLSVSNAWISKFGLSYRNSKIGLGLTLTTPMYGALKSSASYSLEDQKIDLPGSLFEAISNRETLESSNYKTPLSVGFGIDFKINDYSINFSSEYFHKINEYTLFEQSEQTLEGVATGDSEVMVQIASENKSIVNVALGIQYRKTEQTTILAGFRTDRNENNNLLANGTSIYLSNTPDIIHLSGGIMKNFGKNIFSFGLDLGYGKRFGGSQLTDLSNITSENIFSYSGQDIVNTQHYSAMLFITYDFIFSRIVSKKDKA